MQKKLIAALVDAFKKTQPPITSDANHDVWKGMVREAALNLQLADPGFRPAEFYREVGIETRFD